MELKRQRGGLVVSTVASQQEVPDSNLSRGLSVWSLHVLPVLAWVFSRYSGFFQQSKDMHVRLISVSKLPVGVSVSVCGCTSTCGPAMDR